MSNQNPHVESPIEPSGDDAIQPTAPDFIEMPDVPALNTDRKEPLPDVALSRLRLRAFPHRQFLHRLRDFWPRRARPGTGRSQSSPALRFGGRASAHANRGRQEGLRQQLRQLPRGQRSGASPENIRRSLPPNGCSDRKFVWRRFCSRASKVRSPSRELHSRVMSCRRKKRPCRRKSWLI